MPKTNKVIKVENQPTIVNLIEQAIQKDTSVETMERLFALQKDFKSEQAKEMFVQSLANFQKEVPVIEKTKDVMNRDGKTVRYSYAPMDSVIKQIKDSVSDNGFSYNWDSAREDKHIKVVCKLTHVAGHSEKSTFDVPIVPSQFMSSPQSYATAQSFAKRYTLLNVLGIATADEDNDSADTDNNGKPKSEKSQIVFRLKRLGKNTDTKQEIEKDVMALTELKLEQENFKEIIARLDLLVNEQGA